MKGLPNDEEYCFLNAAIQQMFEMSQFRDKVINAAFSGVWYWVVY